MHACPSSLSITLSRQLSSLLVAQRPNHILHNATLACQLLYQSLLLFWWQQVLPRHSNGCMVQAAKYSSSDYQLSTHAPNSRQTASTMAAGEIDCTTAAKVHNSPGTRRKRCTTALPPAGELFVMQLTLECASCMECSWALSLAV